MTRLVAILIFPKTPLPSLTTAIWSYVFFNTNSYNWYCTIIETILYFNYCTGLKIIINYYILLTCIVFVPKLCKIKHSAHSHVAVFFIVSCMALNIYPIFFNNDQLLMLFQVNLLFCKIRTDVRILQRNYFFLMCLHSG